MKNREKNPTTLHTKDLVNTKMNVAVNTGTFPISHCPWSPFQFVFIDQPLDCFNKICDFFNKITISFLLQRVGNYHWLWPLYNFLSIFLIFFWSTHEVHVNLLPSRSWSLWGCLRRGCHQPLQAASNNLCRQLPVTSQTCSGTEVWKSS